MSKVFRYELSRLLGSKFYLGLAAVSLWYGWQLLNNVIILGIANTAPFSPWSFGSYLTELFPLLGVALLFFIWNLCNGQARGIQSLTDATPMKRGRYQMIKYMAALTAWFTLEGMVVALGVGFLCVLFGNSVPVASLLLVSAVTLLPPSALLIGVGALAGGFRSWALFVLMALVFGAGYLPGDIYGRSLFVEYPLSLGVLDPVFSMPLSVLIEKLAVVLIGIGLLFLSTVPKIADHCKR
ncbi:MAG: hypothetical protein VB071_04840 [Lawsonibacter sp.]|nr:hypothetical protein [Lawsonibacter sp.]